jgi:hypothetical protein
MVLFVTGLHEARAFIGVASYTREARYLTVRTATWPTKSPVSRVRLVDEGTSLFELIQAHVAHTSGDALVTVTSTRDFVQQLERMEHLELEWRCAQSDDVLHERDLEEILGARFDPSVVRMKRRAQIPRARAAQARRSSKVTKS